MADFIEESSRLWDHHARRDPLWAILSDPARKGGKWDLNRFMQTGVGEVATLLYQLQSLGMQVRRGSALDFGCGVGRLSQALAPHFARVTGVDISPAMIAKANALNRHPESVTYLCNRSSRLETLADDAFDFILSNIVLQHVRPDVAMEYLREFFRVLAAGGVLVFQLPSHQRPPEEMPVPSGPTVMPDQAYMAAVAVLHLPEADALTPGAEISVKLAVSNRSPIDWAAGEFGVIRAGNHWADARGAVLVRDDGRTSLPPLLRAGDTCHLDLVVHLPGEPGRYYCEFDLAHEGVTWFHDKGSPRTRVLLDLGGAAPHARLTAELVPVAPAFTESIPPLAEPDATEPGDFPMFGVPSDEVIALITSSGLSLRHKDDDHSCGNDWVSYRYVVVK